MKRKLLRTILCFAICSSAMAGLFSNAGKEVRAVSVETQNAIDEAEEEKEQLENELEEQEESKGDLLDRKEGEEQKLDRLKQEYSAVSENLDTMEDQQKEKEAEIRQKEEELEQALKIQEEQYSNMKKRIQYMYERPEEFLLSLFFYEFDIAKILNRVDQTIQIQAYDRAQLEQYKKNTENIQKKREELQNAQNELNQMIIATKHQQTRIASLQQQTSISISEYLNQIASAEIEIGNTEAALQAKSKALMDLYAKAQAEEEAERRQQAEETAQNLQDAMASGAIKQDPSGIVYGNLTLTQAEMEMLTAMIYCESRGESYEGQLAVGHVIMNRVRSSKFPNTLEEVLRANRQFEPAGSGRFDIVLTAYREGIPGVIGQAEWASCKKAAEACVNGESNVAECLFFRTHAPVPQLAQNLEAAGVPYQIIGNHIFYYSWVNY